MDIEKISQYGCSIEAFMGVLGGKYKAIIAYELIGRSLRYSELSRLVPKATPRMLSRQLKEMEADGIVHREQYPVVPPKVEYSLTPLGETLVPMLRQMVEWGNEYFKLAGLPIPCDGDNPFA